VGLNYVVRPRESRLFRQCRRAWDFDARERQDLELTEPAQVFDFGEAIHDALDVYYFPGMWEWNREIVRPLAVAGFEKSMRRQRAAYAHARDLSVEQLDDWEHHMELGAGLLLRYFEWATDIDRFTPIQVATAVLDSHVLNQAPFGVSDAVRLGFLWRTVAAQVAVSTGRLLTVCSF